MAAPDVQVYDELARGLKVALELDGVRFDSGLNAGAITVAPVENLALEKSYRLALSVGADAGNKLIELGALNKSENVSERVKFSIGLDMSKAARRHLVLPKLYL